MKIINSETISNIDKWIHTWRTAEPIPHIVIDNFVDEDRLRRISNAYPDPGAIRKSRDYLFGKNKYEKNNITDLGTDMALLYSDLVSDEFQDFLSRVYGQTVFVDPAFHGGGIHMGGEDSYLDMHADFNVHPTHKNWLRELNILLYVNEHWRPEFGGQLKIRNAFTGQSTEIAPVFNRCVVMLTKEHTLHGYDRIKFPRGTYRKSIAAYAYSHLEAPVTARSTKWVSNHPFRRALAPLVLHLVNAKNAMFGSGSTKNK
jgi:hypothetical protein